MNVNNLTECGLPILIAVQRYVLPNTIKSLSTATDPSVGFNNEGTLEASRMGTPISTVIEPSLDTLGTITPKYNI